MIITNNVLKIAKKLLSWVVIICDESGCIYWDETVYMQFVIGI